MDIILVRLITIHFQSKLEIERFPPEPTIFKHIKRLEDATTLLTCCRTRLDELGSSIAINDNRLKHFESCDQHVKLLKAKVVELKQEMNAQEQNHLPNEIELAGIPEHGNENLHHIVLQAAKKVGVALDDFDIDLVARVGRRVKPAISPEYEAKFWIPVVVRFLRRNKQEEILRAAKATRNITSADLDVPGTLQKVYFNQRLTKQNRLLSRVTIYKSKEYTYLYCWCTNGNIFVKQRESKPPIHICTQEDLLHIFPSASDL